MSLENKNMIMVAGKPANGKTASTRGMDKDKTAYVNIDAKRVPFPDEFQHTYNITKIDDFLPTLGEIEKNKDIDTVVVDTLTFAMEMFETQKVVNARDTQKMWGEYGQFYKRMINGIKASSKRYVVLAHVKDLYNEEEMAVETKVPVAGKVGARGVEADFDLIVFAKKIKDPDAKMGIRYVFQTQLDKDTLNLNIRHPMGMWTDDELYIDNDIELVFKKIAEFYK